MSDAAKRTKHDLLRAIVTAQVSGKTVQKWTRVMHLPVAITCIHICIIDITSICSGSDVDLRNSKQRDRLLRAQDRTHHTQSSDVRAPGEAIYEHSYEGCTGLHQRESQAYALRILCMAGRRMVYVLHAACGTQSPKNALRPAPTSACRISQQSNGILYTVTKKIKSPCITKSKALWQCMDRPSMHSCMGNRACEKQASEPSCSVLAVCCSRVHVGGMCARVPAPMLAPLPNNTC